MFSYILDSPDSKKSTGPEQITKSSHNNKNQEKKVYEPSFSTYLPGRW